MWLIFNYWWFNVGRLKISTFTVDDYGLLEYVGLNGIFVYLLFWKTKFASSQWVLTWSSNQRHKNWHFFFAKIPLKKWHHLERNLSITGQMKTKCFVRICILWCMSLIWHFKVIIWTIIGYKTFKMTNNTLFNVMINKLVCSLMMSIKFCTIFA